MDTQSGGERKKAFFAMTLAQDTPVVVLDELPEALHCADRILTIKDHHLAFDGTAAECLAADIARACFRVRITGDKENGYAVTPLK